MKKVFDYNEEADAFNSALYVKTTEPFSERLLIVNVQATFIKVLFTWQTLWAMLYKNALVFYRTQTTYGSQINVFIVQSNQSLTV